MKTGLMTTIKDVARAANVSTATVSHVLNGTRYVSEELRELVLEAVAELNYRPSRVAASLRTKRSNSILLIIPDIANPFFPPLVRGVQDTFDRHSFAVIVGNTDRRRDREQEFLSLALRTHADGIIINPSEIGYEALLPLIEQDIRVVLIGTHIDHPDLDIVRVDNRVGAGDAVRHLIALGHRRIGMVCGPMSTSSARQRCEGYRHAMEEAELPIRTGWVVEDAFDQEGGYRGTQQLLAHPERPTAIFAAADLMALGVMHAVRDAGLCVPDDVSVVGFDDILEATITTPPLTTINQPKYRMGQCAAELLLARISEGVQAECERAVMEHRLVVRGTTAPPAER
jgi:DNA-binding LacI/PurR family transcriptional regulator